MKLTLTCGRKFHSDHLGAALLRRDALERVVTANPPSTYRRHAFPAERIRHAPPYYLPGLAALRVPLLARLEPALSWWASRRFDRWAARALGAPDAVLAWAWSAQRTFDAARARGLLCILEECGSANAHQEALLADEYRRLGLARRTTLPPAVIDAERRECELADVILCPSDYVADSYAIYGVPRAKCLVLPYASDASRFARPKFAPTDGRLHILYIGSVGPRKGLVYLLQALRQLPRARFTCTVVGRVESGFAPVLGPYADLFRHVPAVPHDELAGYYQRASVFVLPTLDEGMAYVVSEALCSGTPVITTPHSGAAAIVREGVNGHLVPIRDPEAIASRLVGLIDAPDRLAAFGRAAAATAAAWTWDDYAQTLLEKLALRRPPRPLA